MVLKLSLNQPIKNLFLLWKIIETGHSQIINVNFLQKKDGTWEEVTIYFKDFQEIVIGENTGNMMKSKSLKNIVRMGIMTYEIAINKKFA
jgi:hypothetical protein